MLEELWHGLIQFTEPYVVPDWGSLVQLLPVFLAAFVALYVSWTAYRYATAAPTRRGIRRLPPAPPPGVHMPGPSFAPLLGAVGFFMLLFGVFAGGIWLAAGVVVLVITLLYWGREALREFDHVTPPATGPAVGALPVPVGGVPPEGVHIPPPSFRPLLVSIALTVMVAGLVVGGWAILAGFVAIALTGLGWLRDARREWTAVENADRTGHLDLGSAPAWPKATFAALAIVVAGALLLSSGGLPNSGGAAVPSTVPAGGGSGGSGGGGGGGGGGGTASAAPSQPAADVSIAAQGIAFDTATLTIPAGKAFTLAFDNRDASVPHDVVIRDASGKALFTGELITGPRVIVYEVPAIPAGTYTFVCTVHANMTGTVTAK